MKNLIKVSFLFALMFLISCSSNDEAIILDPADNSKSVADCGEAFVSPERNYFCLGGAPEVLPGEILNYAFKHNSRNTDVTWSIESGEMEILNIETSVSGDFTISIATIKFDSDFDGGFLKASSIPNENKGEGFVLTEINPE